MHLDPKFFDHLVKSKLELNVRKDMYIWFVFLILVLLHLSHSLSSSSQQLFKLFGSSVLLFSVYLVTLELN